MRNSLQIICSTTLVTTTTWEVHKDSDLIAHGRVESVGETHLVDGVVELYWVFTSSRFLLLGSSDGTMLPVLVATCSFFLICYTVLVAFVLWGHWVGQFVLLLSVFPSVCLVGNDG
jgi:hypothetical protein